MKMTQSSFKTSKHDFFPCR